MTNYEWDSGLIITIGKEFTDGQNIGSISMADFTENIVELDCGDGFFWRGTSQEFSLKWEEI